MRKLFLALLALPLLAGPQYQWEVPTQFVPTTLTTIKTQTVHVRQINIVNVSGSPVTFTLQDASTNCNSGPCAVFAASISANSTYIIPVNGSRATSGLQWIAGTANALSAWVGGDI